MRASSLLAGKADTLTMRARTLARPNHRQASRIPVELCLTSNLLTQSVPALEDHHFQLFYAQGHPVVLCTDDTGLFATSLSREYALAAASFGLERQALAALAAAAVEHCFCSEQEKGGPRAVMRRFARDEQLALPGAGAGGAGK